MRSDYWNKISEQRATRRRVLAGSLAAATGAALLAACGGSSDQAAVIGNLSKPEDTTKNAKRGGKLIDRRDADVATLDGAGPPYSNLLKYKPGHLKQSDFEVVGDLAESWERSPDGLQIVMRLRPNIKFHNKPPVNGRAMDVQDVLFSWERFGAVNSSRSEVVNSVNPGAPVVSLTAPDARTIVVKLTLPLADGPGLLADYINVMPKETDSTFDPRSDQIGTGPLILTRYVPSASFSYRRNPDYYDQDSIFLDEVEQPILSEYATALSQLQSGNILFFGTTTASRIKPEDVIVVKRAEPRIQMFQGEWTAAGNFIGRTSFGFNPGSPFLDERVRQAFSMSRDYDLYLETFHTPAAFESEGLPIETRLCTAIDAVNEGWWLDPRSKEFGPNAKYLQFDLAEAKKLMAAAGYPQGFEVTANYLGGPRGGNAAQHSEVLNGMIAQLGIKQKVEVLDQNTTYNAMTRSRGQFDGYVYKSQGGSSTPGKPLVNLLREYYSKGGGSDSFYGFDAAGKGDKSGDPQVDLLLEKARIELDTNRRRELLYDLQRHLAKPMYVLPAPGLATGFLPAWPALGNFRVHNINATGVTGYHGIWIDQTKPPYAG